MSSLPTFGALPVPELPAVPFAPGLGWPVFALAGVAVVLLLVLGERRLMRRDIAPGSEPTDAVLTLLLIVAACGAAGHHLWARSIWQDEVDAVWAERRAIEAHAAQEIADWYGVHPIDVPVDGAEHSFLLAYVEVDGVVPTDCYTLARDGRIGIACGPEPATQEEALATLVELPRAGVPADETVRGER